MVKNLAEYFQDEQDIFLEEISYSKMENEVASEFSLNCTDNISTQIIENQGIKIVVTRTLEFEPKCVFSMKVAFGAKLYFEEDKIKEVDWNKLNLADEFRENGEFVINELMSRITLMIAQITASFGQVPLILPPVIPRDKTQSE